MTALISATSLSSGSGGRPIRFFGRSRMRSIRLERETPITSATVFIANRPSAATAAAAARSLELLHEHLAHDDLVAWGWSPGSGRDPVPGTQEVLGELIRAWIDSGAECP